MNLKFKDIVNTYKKMEDNGVVIYGAGKRGNMALNTLTSSPNN